MSRSVWLVAGVAALSVLLFACAGPSDVKIDETANGTDVSLRAGQKLIVTLKSNPTTGYDWQVDEVDESVGHVGWYFDLPYAVDATDDGVDNDGDGEVDEEGEVRAAGERVIKDVIIREGKAIVISFIPDDSPCSGGGASIVHEMSACSGGRVGKAVFDITGDRLVSEEEDVITIEEDGEEIEVPPTGRMYDGMLHVPVVATDPDRSRDRELKIFSSSSGTTEILWERRERTGIRYWREY